MIDLDSLDDAAQAEGGGRASSSDRNGDVGMIPTELAAARILSQEYGDDILFDVDRGQYRIWNGQCWVLDTTGEVHRCAKRCARETKMRFGMLSKNLLLPAIKRLESAAGINGVLSLLKSEPGIPVTSSELDQNRYLLNCQNGTLNVRTGRLEPFRREDLLTKQIATPYDPAAKAPLLEKFLNRIMGGNRALIGYLQRIAGLSLTGDISEQELWIFYGAGANGKSVFIDTLMEMLGSYAGVAPESLLIARQHGEHPTEIADLHGKRLVVASETEEGGKLRLQLIKRLTGDAFLKGRFMRQDFFQFPRTHKTILVTNNRPRIPESTEAAWRRIRLVPFNVVIPEKERDTKLSQKLRDEWPGVLAWAVRGFLDYQQHGMRPPEEVIAATDDYRNDEASADTFDDYRTARLILGAAEVYRVSRPAVWADYQDWAAKTRVSDRLDRRALYDRLRQLTGVADGSWQEGGAAVRGFRGAGLCRSCAPTGEQQWTGANELDPDDQ